MKKDSSKITPWGKKEVSGLLKNAGVEVENDALYDSVYVANMCKADYLGSSIADCARKGVIIPWEDVV